MKEGSYYDKARADYAVAFIECLFHTKGRWAGEPFELIDWQEQIIRDILGTIKSNGYRQLNTAYVEIPMKQGKSELAAAVALYLCCGDGEQRAEVYSCASDRQQASIVYEVAADMVRMYPALSKRVKILASQKKMIFEPTNSIYQVLSAEAYSKHGLNISGVVYDELHVADRKMFDVMTKGSGDARPQPLLQVHQRQKSSILSLVEELDAFSDGTAAEGNPDRHYWIGRNIQIMRFIGYFKSSFPDCFNAAVHIVCLEGNMIYNPISSSRLCISEHLNEPVTGGDHAAG